MILNGWIKYNSLNELNKVADVPNQPQEVRQLLIREGYVLDINKIN